MTHLPDYVIEFLRKDVGVPDVAEPVSDVLEQLVSARDYVRANPSKWVRHGGDSVDGTYCIVTARFRAAPDGVLSKLKGGRATVHNFYISEAGSRLGLSSGAFAPVLWNDSPSSSYEGVRSLFEKAVEMATEDLAELKKV